MFKLEISPKEKNVNQQEILEAIFNSMYPTLSIKERVQLSVISRTDGAFTGDAQTQYVHNFGYIPQCIGFVTTAEGHYISAPQTWESQPGEGEGSSPYPNRDETFNLYTDDTFVTVEANCYEYTPAVGGEYVDNEYTFDVILFMEEALLA